MREKSATFAFRLTPDELRALEELARVEERNPSDIMRRLLRREHAAVVAARKEGEAASEPR